MDSVLAPMQDLDRTQPYFAALSEGELASLLASVQDDVHEDQRLANREAFTGAIVLAAIDIARNEVVGAPLIVHGRDISATGVSFFHNKSLSDRTFVAGFRNGNGVIQSVLVNIIWTQRRADGRYFSGACFAKRLDDGVSLSGVSLPASGGMTGSTA